MEELNDSLEDYEVNEGIPTVISRNTTGMEGYHSGNEQSGNPVSLMQTGPFMVYRDNERSLLAVVSNLECFHMFHAP